MTDPVIAKSVHTSTDAIDGMTRRWDFVATPVQRWRIRQAVETVIRRSQPRPDWKALPGYDFSAYSAALREISRRSRHADVLVINDSVFGPFTDIRTVLASAPWELTGFTATSQVENHIQSYAFVLKDVTPARMRALATVMFPWRALSKPHDVIQVQETRFARIASQSLKVGAYWFAEKEAVLDPTLFRPIELIHSGFPFLKRSLLGKHQTLQDPEEIRELLFALQHPVPARA